MGWFQSDTGSWYCFDENGYARTGWYEENGIRYYLGITDGRLFTDCTSYLEDSWYSFDGEGKSTYTGTDHIGWLWDGVHWLYRKPSGAYVTDGWHTIDDASYYFSEGHLATGPFSIGGENYFFDSQGQKASGLTVWKNDFYYINDDQTVLKNSEKEIDGILYRFDETGRGSMVSQRPSAPSMNFIPGEDWPYKAVTEIPPENEKTELHRTCDQMADQILSEIINDAMDQRQKAEAIYNWVRGNIRYSELSHPRLVQEAYRASAAAGRLLYLLFCIPAAFKPGRDRRHRGVRSTDNHHYWNLVNIDGSWYHFDATPRRARGYFFLWTDDQMEQYSRQHGGCFTFDRRLYPATPE
ncbi:MAG: hypothetical protein ACLU8D_02715 [Enterocloster sp.]